MTEWEFTADAASWINEILAKNASLPFSRAKCELRGKGSLKRRDLTLLDKDRRAVLTGEVKLPHAREGSSPYVSSVVSDAREKASRAKARFFFTWNVNEFVLWETTLPDTSWQQQKYKSWPVAKVHREEHLELPNTVHALQIWLAQFLNEFAQIIRGTALIGLKSPDEKFVEALESFLHLPILLNLERLGEMYGSPAFKIELDAWMRDEQGWTIRDDTEGVQENLERASRFACYALMNKIVFHEALLKRYGLDMDRLSVPDHIDTGEALRLHLEQYFAVAKRVTGDYETVFGEDHKSIGNRIPFCSNSAVPHWQGLIDQIHQFDFSKLDYEIIGKIFERLIGPEERSKYGQFYTKVEVVDLINSFCIRRGDESLMDPACGGGTFLVRAYARKRELAPERGHRQLLSELLGVDISRFATHLTTINLTTRDLVEEDNYPLVARSDFFDVGAGKVFLTLPTKLRVGGLGKAQQRKITVPRLDAVVGNPPYIAQEDIRKSRSKSKNKPDRGSKEYYQLLVTKESGVRLSGRSDIHCYFWPHASTFLREDGYLCFLTSSLWLDTEYGFRLQDWILGNFEIVAVFESIDEPWFVGARVVTAITILRAQPDEEARMKNKVRFVQLRRPMGEILSNDGSTASVVCATDGFRDEVLSLTENTVNERFRARLVPQVDLWKDGVELGRLMARSGERVDGGGAEDDGDQGEGGWPAGSEDRYYGGKWGLYVRAPDLWFQLQDETSSRWERLGQIAEVRRGITSGCDDFFYVFDVTEDYLKIRDAADFRSKTGYPQKLFESRQVRLVRCGEKHDELRAIEAKYLEPEIHSLMEVEGYWITSTDCKRHALMVSKSREDLQGTHVLEYIHWGESQNWHRGTTCAARVTEKRAWYDITGHRRAPALWPKERQYRHIAPANGEGIVANCRMYEVYPPPGLDNPDLWGGILNSTWVLLSSLQFGRPVGNEGNWSTMVVDVNMMLVPDPAKATKEQCARVVEAFAALKNRPALQFLSERRLRTMAYEQSGKATDLASLPDFCEMDTADRRALDDAILQLLGVGSSTRRQDLIDALYSYLRQFFEWTRRKEEKAIGNKNRSRRRGPARPGEIALWIYKDIAEKETDLLRQYQAHFLDRTKTFDTFEIPPDGRAQVYSDMFIANGVKFTKGKDIQIALLETKTATQSNLIAILANNGVYGLVSIPHEGDECLRVLHEYSDFITHRGCRMRELIRERTADEDLQEMVYEALVPLMVQDYGR